MTINAHVRGRTANTVWRRTITCGVAILLSGLVNSAQAQSTPLPKMHGALLSPSSANASRLREIKSAGANTAVLVLRDASEQENAAIRAAARRVEQAGLALAYWIEVARSPALAKQHPEWMASLQTHDEWRRFFPKAAQPKANEVAKTYPWVPILSREPFQAQRERIVAMLANVPAPKQIFLNDIQGAPSACGCGNPLCRWTSDYGKRRTTTPIGDEAPALFVKAVQAASPQAEVIPVWTTECEEHDGAADGLCAGVGCFNGICWKAYTRQLMPVAVACPRLAVLTPYKAFQRDTLHYDRVKAGWVAFAIKTFQTMPPRHQGKAIAASRIVAVIQGWDATPEEVQAQQNAAKSVGANGVLIAYEKIEQSWSPKIVQWK